MLTHVAFEFYPNCLSIPPTPTTIQARRSEGKARVSKRATPAYVPFQMTWAVRTSTLNKKQATAMGLPTSRIDERSSRQGHPAVYATKEFYRYLCYIERTVSATLQKLAVVEQPSDVFKQLKVALVGNAVATELLRGTYTRIGGTTALYADKVRHAACGTIILYQPKQPPRTVC